MYQSHWDLREKPFEPAIDRRFYYPSESHQAAALKLQYAISGHRPAALLAGTAGIGKSLLIDWITSQLDEVVGPRLNLVYPRMTGQEILRWLAEGLAPTPEPRELAGADRCVRQIQQALEDNASQKRHALVVVDEAHLLDGEQLEGLRLVTNFRASGEAALTLVLVGQPSLLPRLERFSSFEERLGVKCLLRPFSLEESVSYVSHRLRTAGCGRAIFDDSGMEALHELSGGIPRRINRLADLALLVGFAEQAATLDRSHVEAVCEELVAIRPE